MINVLVPLLTLSVQSVHSVSILKVQPPAGSRHLAATGVLVSSCYLNITSLCVCRHKFEECILLQLWYNDCSVLRTANLFWFQGGDLGNANESPCTDVYESQIHAIAPTSHMQLHLDTVEDNKRRAADALLVTTNTCEPTKKT